ncbi:MAG: hypothetical protein U0V70_20360 [Terriglobia bacterium]
MNRKKDSTSVAGNPQALILDPPIPDRVLQPVRPAGLYETWHMEETSAGIYLLYGHSQVLTLAQKLACRCLLQAEHLIVLDGANVFDPYLVSRLAAKMGRAPTDFLRRIRISRSFTCHQMLSLVRQIDQTGKLWKSPFILLLGPLTTFYDESVPHYEAWKLFRAFRRELKNLTAAGFRLLLSCQQPGAATRRDFVQQLKSSTRGIASCWEMRPGAAALQTKETGLLPELEKGKRRAAPSPRTTSSQLSRKPEEKLRILPGREAVAREKYLVLKVEKPAESQRQWVLRRGERVNSRYLSL